MKQIIRNILIGLSIILPLSTQAAQITFSPTSYKTANSYENLGLSISPENKNNKNIILTTDDFISAQINDYHPMTIGGKRRDIFLLDQSGNDFDLEIISIVKSTQTSSTGIGTIALMALNPFEYNINLGMLSAGDYSMTANYNGNRAISGNFTVVSASSEPVSPVPLPATAWLLISGLMLIFSLSKSKNIVVNFS